MLSFIRGSDGGRTEGEARDGGGLSRGWGWSILTGWKWLVLV